MNSAYLQQWIEHPETLDKDTLYELRTLVTRYPYFQSLRLLYLKNLYLLHDATFGAELRKAVLYVADRRTLFYLIEGDRYTLKPQKASRLSAADKAEEPSMDRTLFLIDNFLASMPDEQPQEMELDYSMDYTAYLMKQDAEADDASATAEVPRLRGQNLIDDFLNREESETFAPKAEEAEETEAEQVAGEVTAGVEEETAEKTENRADDDLDEGCFTETLAKIYIKQHRYEKALEIIKKLSLNYPKKNAYFADQIRFLEKLIINAKSK
ncbi:MAG: tetratricopeptide repeat protein [Bacteroides sp.]|nr:tetratricopeptide repeat protein [Bacteroides sp.]